MIQGPNGFNIVGTFLKYMKKMSAAMKMKHNMRDFFSLYPLKEGQKIVKITECRGNNLHEIETPEKTRFLVSMPKRFRQSIWVKRGFYVVIDPIEEGVKVKGEIVRILQDFHIAYYQEINQWPEAFIHKPKLRGLTEDSDDDDDDDNEIPVNTNRQSPPHSESDDSEDSESDSSDNDC